MAAHQSKTRSPTHTPSLLITMDPADHWLTELVEGAKKWSWPELILVSCAWSAFLFMMLLECGDALHTRWQRSEDRRSHQRLKKEWDRISERASRYSEDSEAEEADAPACRICLAAEVADAPLVRPCACRGSNAWVHADCLSYWRKTSPKPLSAICCDQCGERYNDALSIELLTERLHKQRRKWFAFSRSASWLGRAARAFSAAARALGVTGATRIDDLTTQEELGNLLRTQGRLAEAEPLLREVVEARRAQHGRRHSSTIRSTIFLSQLLQDGRQLVEAEALCREALQASRELWGDKHESTLASLFVRSSCSLSPHR